MLASIAFTFYFYLRNASYVSSHGFPFSLYLFPSLTTERKNTRSPTNSTPTTMTAIFLLDISYFCLGLIEE